MIQTLMTAPTRSNVLPVPPRFNGADYIPERDQPRLADQHQRVLEAIKDGEWKSLKAISEITGDPQASVSAQLRHLRKPRFGSWIIDKKYEGHGLYLYRMNGKMIGTPDKPSADTWVDYKIRNAELEKENKKLRELLEMRSESAAESKRRIAAAPKEEQPMLF